MWPVGEASTPDPSSSPVVSTAPSAEAIRVAIGNICDELKDLLFAKNASYGNSAADPINVFAKCDWETQVNVRIDDKLSRIKNGVEYGNEDSELDLAGYLILKRAIRRANGQ